MVDGFKAEYFEVLASLEKDNFWFKVRNRVIIWAIQKYSSNINSFLEIGCGTGFGTQAVANEFPDVKLTGSDYYEEGLEYARQRVHGAAFIQLDARNMPYESDFSMVGAFDVLEHIKDDVLVLEQINKALIQDGVLLLTVPQHQWLWSRTDEYACHERRYSAAELHEKIEKAGFLIMRSTSFVTTLLPIMLLSRLFDNKKDIATYDVMSQLRLNPVLNKFMEYFMTLDLLMIRLGFNLPLGGSRLIVARKV